MAPKSILNIAEAKSIVDKKPRDKVNTIIVTGVTGQDGSLMVDYLLKNTDAIIFGGVRRLSVYNHTNISHITSDRFHLVNFDLTDAHAISSIIEKLKPDYFINFAAQSFVASSWDFSSQTWETNSTAVMNILESIRLYRPSCRFYNAGSSEEFGNVQYTPQNEKHPLMPRSPYGASKAAARQLVKVYRESYGLYAIQSWLFNHEGVRRGEEFVTRKISKGVAKIEHAIRNDQPFYPIELGNVYAKRDWSDAEDFVECVWMMLNQDVYRKEYNNVENVKEYVLSSNESNTIKEFIENAFKVVGIEGGWHGEGASEEYSITKPLVTRVRPKSSILVKINPAFYRPAEVECLLGDSSLFRKDFNWTQKTNFNMLVEKMVKNDIIP